MNLVTRDETTILLSPSVCAICEQAPQEGTVLVDTLRNFEQGINGIGRKYVCESCVGELGSTLGLGSGHGERVALAENAAYARAFETLRHRLTEQTKELVKLVNEPLSNLDPIYDPVELFVEQVEIAAAKPKRANKKEAEQVVIESETGQAGVEPPLQKEYPIHIPSSAGV